MNLLRSRSRSLSVLFTINCCLVFYSWCSCTYCCSCSCCYIFFFVIELLYNFLRIFRIFSTKFFMAFILKPLLCIHVRWACMYVFVFFHQLYLEVFCEYYFCSSVLFLVFRFAQLKDSVEISWADLKSLRVFKLLHMHTIAIENIQAHIFVLNFDFHMVV